MKTLIIAEAGVNHNGDLERAREMVRVAAAAGADLVKFQTFSADSIAAAHAPKADYQIAATGTGESQREMIRRLELSPDDHRALRQECETAGIGFFSTGFDIAAVDFLVGLGAERIKLPSGEITNLPLLRHVAAKRLPVILSTGMATMAEVGAAVEVLREGIALDDLTILHCTTDYPTAMSDVNLHVMPTLGEAFGTAFGYSDHSVGIEVAVAAVALGASVIEKHFTMSRALPGPDHAASLEPDELAAMVAAIRNIEVAVAGDRIKRPTQAELRNRVVARKSLVAAAAIAAGEVFSVANLTTKRPGTGISPMRWDDVIGRPASRSYQADELIEW